MSVVTEDEASNGTSAPASDSSTTSTKSGGTGYPSVSKWESGVQRGAANQIGITKWADVVGAKLNRGKANRLSEQYTQPAFNSMVDAKNKENQKEEDFKSQNYVLTIPGDAQILVPKAVRNVKTKVMIWGDDVAEKNKAFFNEYLTNPLYKQYDEIIPKGNEINKIVPSGTLRAFIVNGKWFRMQLKYDKKTGWKFSGYFDDQDHPYQQDMYINPNEVPDAFKKDSFWKEWNNAILLTVGLVAAFVIPGAAGLWIGLGFDLTAVATSMFYGDNVGAALGLVASFLPFIGEALKIGQITTSQARRIMNSLQYAKNEEELVALINGIAKSPGGRLLTQQDRYILKVLVNSDPKDIGKLINNVVKQNAKIVKTAEAIERGQKMNEIISTVKQLSAEGKVANSTAKSFLKTYGFESVAFIGGSLFGLSQIGEILTGLQRYLDTIKGDPEAHNEDYQRFVELNKTWLDLEPQILENEREDLENKIIPLNKNYNFTVENRYPDDEEGKATKSIITLSIMLAMVRAYVMNPESDLQQVGDNQLAIEQKKYEDREK